MIVTKKMLKRRTFLRGMGVSVALPLLEAMVPALTATAATAANARKRLGCLYVPHGAFPGHWTPPTTGVDFKLSQILAPIEPYRQSVVVVTNLIRPEQRDNTNHAGAPASYLAGMPPKRTDGPDFRIGVTVDQLVAKQIGQDTTFPSLEVATEDFTALLGSCAPGYSCAYANTLSWQSPTTPLPMEINPRLLFERLFGSGDTAEQRMARMHQDQSVLDFISEELGDLRRTIGPTDHGRLSDYLDHVREVERRIQRAEQQAHSNLVIPTAPVGVPDSFEEHVGLQFELLALAYQADLTRVFTFMMARELSQRTFPQIGANLPHHMLSHHANNPERITGYSKVGVHYLELFTKFVDRLQSTPDGDGTLFDHTLLLYGSGMGDGDLHAADHLPLLVIGGKGLVNGNRHIEAPARTPNANLLLSIAQRLGVETDHFGVSTGTIDI
jgi:Protein of unknown function (DUF1552)